MADVRYQIFISSTYTDLIAERQALSHAILDLGHIPAGMELFPAADLEQMNYIEKVIDECDYYLLVLGARYGSLDSEGISFTEREFEYAASSGKTVLAFVHSNMDAIPLGKTDKDKEKYEKLLKFREKVQEGRLVRFWTNPDDLASQAIVSLTKAFQSHPQVGWVRGDRVPSQADATGMLKLREENDRLRSQISSIKNSASPKFQDVADLKSAVEVRYRFWNGGSGIDSKKELEYTELLKVLGPVLHTPATLSGVSIAFKEALKERFGLRATTIAPNGSDLQDALLHFVATGHVKMWPSKTSDGKNVTGYQLTPLGEKHWLESSYTRDAGGISEA